MPTILKFEDLEVWKLARELNVKLIPYLQILNESKNFELKNQLDNAAGSVMDNIAEGFERDGNKEFIQFLAISKGSLGEVRSQLYRVFDRGFVEAEILDGLQLDCRNLAGKIGAFISYLKNSNLKGIKYK